MGIFKSLFGGKSESEPTWDIKPASERPPAWEEDKSAKTKIDTSIPKAPAKEPNPFLDDEMLDTMQLEAETLHEDNPYQTHSWEMDREEDTRKLRTIQTGKLETKDPDDTFNPYDTGEFRRGWKD